MFSLEESEEERVIRPSSTLDTRFPLFQESTAMKQNLTFVFQASGDV